ncbi:MAG: SIS domain-containing protein [Planctomycetota bacterium]|nr:SIS domain-containing protein [Planctomycetota bacterium]
MASASSDARSAAPPAVANRFELALRDARAVLAALDGDAKTRPFVAALVARCAAAARAGGKILVCGNGGSLCDAAHFAEELTGRFRADRPPIAAIACADAGHLTCTANDYGFDEVFARWVKALARPGDVVVLLSTSGKSANIVKAAEAAKAAGATTAALLGKGGGPMKGTCDLELVVAGETSDRIQELHMFLLHAVVEGVECTLGYV